MNDRPAGSGGGGVVITCFILENTTWCVSLGANSETDYCKGSSLGSAPKINTGREVKIAELGRERSWIAVK